MSRKKPRFTPDPPPYGASNEQILAWVNAQLQRIEDYWPRDDGDRITALEELQSKFSGEWAITGQSIVRFEGAIAEGIPPLACSVTSTGINSGGYSDSVINIEYSPLEDIIVAVLYDNNVTPTGGGVVLIDGTTETLTISKTNPSSLRVTSGGLASSTGTENKEWVVLEGYLDGSNPSAVNVFSLPSLSIEFGVGWGSGRSSKYLGETTDYLVFSYDAPGTASPPQDDAVMALINKAGPTYSYIVPGSGFTFSTSNSSVPRRFAETAAGDMLIFAKRTSDNALGVLTYTPNNASIGTAFTSWGLDTGDIQQTLGGNPFADSAGNLYWLVWTTNGHSGFVVTGNDGNYVKLVEFTPTNYPDAPWGGYASIGITTFGALGNNGFGSYDSATNSIWFHGILTGSTPNKNIVARYYITKDELDWCEVVDPAGWSNIFYRAPMVWHNGKTYVVEDRATFSGSDYTLIIKQEVGGI